MSSQGCIAISDLSVEVLCIFVVNEVFDTKEFDMRADGSDTYDWHLG